MNGETAALIKIQTPERGFSVDGGMQDVNILSNTQWSVSGKNNWLDFNQSTGNGNGVLSVVVAPNTTIGAIMSMSLVLHMLYRVLQEMVFLLIRLGTSNMQPSQFAR